MFAPVQDIVREMTQGFAWAGPALILGAIIGIAVIVYLCVRIGKGEKL